MSQIMMPLNGLDIVRLRLERLYPLVESIPWVPMLLAAGIALRWVSMLSGSLWYDEAFSVMVSRLGLLEMMQALRGNLGLTAVMGLLLWTHNVAPFFVLPNGLLALLVHPRDWRLVIDSGSGALLAWLPWVPTIFNRSQAITGSMMPLVLSVFIFTFWFDLFASSLPLTGMFGLVILWASATIAMIVQMASLFHSIPRLLHASKQISLSLPSLSERLEYMGLNKRAWVPVYSFGLPLLLFLLCAVLYQNVLAYRPGSAYPTA